MARLPRTVITTLDKAKIVGIRAGADHRFIGVWPVVVAGRLFVRSWTRKPDGWHRAFQKDRRGAIQAGERTLAVIAKPVTSERLQKAVDAAYREKYNTPGALTYVRGFHRPARRKTTTEFVPAGRKHA